MLFDARADGEAALTPPALLQVVLLRAGHVTVRVGLP
jgi:hypothetical protein